jgi:hypothetical protein
MKAVMSDKLRKIISNPKTNRELQEKMSKLSSVCDSKNSSTEISIDDHKYRVHFISVSDPKIMK